MLSLAKKEFYKASLNENKYNYKKSLEYVTIY